VIPQLRNWYDKYEKQGFTIIGVHSPEFFWEKPLDKVKTAIEQLKVRYPVVQDNNFDTWKRFGIWAWPSTVLIDKQGVIRYAHIGEGAYEKTESLIKQLLVEKD
jgi:peroxiredoxin